VIANPWTDAQFLFAWRNETGKETSALFTVRDATEGVHIFGGKGSGKTSGSLATLAKAYLRAGMGGLVLTSTPEDAALWQKYAHETRRTADLKVLTARKEPFPARFNFLEAEAKREATGASVENVVELLMTMIEFTGGGSGRATDQPYWELATRDLLRNAVTLNLHTSDQLRVAELKDIVTSPLCPQGHSDDMEVRAWHATPAGQRLALLQAKAENESSEGRRADLLDTLYYWTVLFPNLPEETRRTITTYFTGLMAVFLRHPFRELFCSETTLHPRQTWEEGAVIVLDLPVLEYHESGKLAQAVFKYMFQREAQGHDVKRFPRPVFLFEDEKQLFLTRHDFLFDSISRSFRVCSVAATQSISQYHAVLSRHGGEAQAESFLGNYQTQIFHANTSAKTNLWASETIGRTQTFRGSMTLDAKQRSASLFGGSGGSQSMHEQYDFHVQPSEFIGLARGGAEYDRRVEAFALKAGKPFQTNNKHKEKNHLKTVFLQNI
jgi:type IV secretory pathway TraG/TraD family ATPase VirD4